MKKNIKAAVMAALMILCVFFSACSKAKTANTAEAYFTYEDQFRKAGFTKRIQHMYVAGEGKYATPEELKKAVGEPEVTGVVEWDSSGEKCTSYNLDADGNKIGAVTYTFRYNKAKKRIARIGNGYYTDYTYEDGRIMKITRYAGEKKTADAQAIMVAEFKYDANDVNSIVSVTDDTEDTIVYVSDAGEEESHTDFTYNDKGLIIDSTRYGKDNQLLVYTEYTYE